MKQNGTRHNAPINIKLKILGFARIQLVEWVFK